MKISRETGLHQASIWVGAVLIGGSAVIYAQVTSEIHHWFFYWFAKWPKIVLLTSPLFFLTATFLVRKFAPHAKGSGIPQVLQAIEDGGHPTADHRAWSSPLISLRTALIKVLSSCIGLLGGASIGREGPTVQIAASVYAAVGRLVQKRVPHIKLPSYLIAGAAAGVAAAFNTPLAGITFAIEEIIDGVLGSIRQMMLLSVIISGITAQAFLGNYLYFGRPMVSQPDFSVLYQSLIIGLVGGLLGGAFARFLAFPQISRLPKHWAWRAFLCGAICSLIAWLTNGESAGSGYEATQATLRSTSVETTGLFFPLYKMGTTVLSYLSGMAGGIFSPSLSIGAGVGVSVAKILHFANFRTCALMGMVAFFSGVVQAPFTAVIIVMEMTDRHILILPFMVAAFLGQAIGKLWMPVPLYHFLAKRQDEGQVESSVQALASGEESPSWRDRG